MQTYSTFQQQPKFNKLIKRIAHIADVHLKDPRFETEYRTVIGRLVEALRELDVDRIVVAGDVFHTKNTVRNETKILGRDFLQALSEVAVTVVIDGNHDGNPNNADQLNSLETLISLMANPRILYFGETGLYPDSNVEWAVWDYFDGKSPYEHADPDPRLKTVDLYHNPISGCDLYGGTRMDGYPFSAQNFRGDIAMLGDIHKRQFFDIPNGRGAYPGSLLQNNHGEDLNPHGFLVWDLEKGTCEEHNVQSDYGYFTLKIGPEDNPATVPMSVPDVPTFLRLRIDWSGQSSVVNPEHERLLRKRIREELSGRIVELKFRKALTDVKVTESAEGVKSNGLDLADPTVMELVFRRFMTANGHPTELQDAVVEHHMRMLSSVDYEQKSSNWRLMSIYLDNYRSHGDRFDLDLRKMDGLTQVRGRNEQGKTNLLSAVCYLLYGRTLETLKKEKNGDARFINNKRKLDHCEVGAVIEVNGESFSIRRRTERKWNRSKTEISGASTTFDFALLGDLGQELSQNDEQRSKTQKLLEESLGTFDDFMRASFVTADSLNGLLSSDEATFMDAMIRDAGIDVFELLQDAHKDWRKANPISKPRIVPSDNEAMVEVLSGRVSELESEALASEQKSAAMRSDADALDAKTPEILSRKKQVDLTLTDVEFRSNEAEAMRIRSQSEQNALTVAQLESQIQRLPTEFTQGDEEELRMLLLHIADHETFTEETRRNIADVKAESYKHESAIVSEKNRLDSMRVTADQKDRLAISERSQMEAKVHGLRRQLAEAEEAPLECPTCGQATDRTKVEKKADDLRQRIFEETNGSYHLVEAGNLEAEAVVLRKQADDASEKLERLRRESDHSERVKCMEAEFVRRHGEMDPVRTRQQDLEAKRSNVDLRQQSVVREMSIQQQNAALSERLAIVESRMQSYRQLESVREHNAQVDRDYATHVASIAAVRRQAEESSQRAAVLRAGDIPRTRSEMDVLRKQVRDFLEAERLERILDLYAQCVHRSGIPKMLLTGMRDSLNAELGNLLSPLTFCAYFDENMGLRMYDHLSPDQTMPVIGGSGKQRTFISLALRWALRINNSRCTNNVLFLDELMGKLVDNSVQEFTDLVGELKERIERIFIVEHAYSDVIFPDHVLEVEKDQRGVSSIRVVS